MPQELKIRLEKPEEVEAKLKTLAAISEGTTEFTDTYFSQPIGEVLKTTESDEGISLVALRAEDGKFRITKKEAIGDLEKIKNELSSKYRIKRILKGHRRYFSLAGFKITLNFIDTVGNFLILTGENPTKEFIEETLGIENPEYISVSFDNL